jgi:hypothetical protein
VVVVVVVVVVAVVVVGVFDSTTNLRCLFAFPHHLRVSIETAPCEVNDTDSVSQEDLSTAGLG